MKFEKNDPRLIPDPPPWFTKAQRMAYYKKDLEDVFGADYIERSQPTRPNAPQFKYRMDYKKRYKESKPISAEHDIGLQTFLEKIHEPQTPELDIPCLDIAS